MSFDAGTYRPPRRIDWTGIGFAVVLTVIDKTLIEPLPYDRPNDLYFVWRDLSSITDIKRGWFARLFGW